MIQCVVKHKQPNFQRSHDSKIDTLDAVYAETELTKWFVPSITSYTHQILCSHFGLVSGMSYDSLLSLRTPQNMLIFN